MMVLNQFGDDYEPAGKTSVFLVDVFLCFSWLLPLAGFGADGPDILSYYDVKGTIGQKSYIIICIWIFWMGVAMVALKNVRHQKR